jgi:hypothetical protein
MSQFSIRWFLTLNCLSQKARQVQMQAAILGGDAGIRGAATGTRTTNTALIIANTQTDSAMDTAAHNTGIALTKSYRNLRKALGKAAEKTGEALGK